MKKIAIILGALTLASAAYAKEAVKPELKVSKVGAFIDIYDTNVDVGVKVDEDNIGVDGNLQRIEAGVRGEMTYGEEWTYEFSASNNWISGVKDVAKSIRIDGEDLG